MKESDKLIKNDSFLLYRLINHGYAIFAIVKKFTFKIMWNGSCLGFMFLMPFMFEVLTEQQAVLDKIQTDDMLSQGNDMGGFDPNQGSQPIVRPF